MAERLAAAGIAMETDASTGHANDTDHARAGARIVAYLIDSAVLFCFSMFFLVAAFLVLFLDSDQGRDDISDSEARAVVVLLLASLPAWFLFSLALSIKRGQTVGQYVVGLGIQNEDGSPATPRRLVLYWLSLHPLIFHPIIAGSWLFLAWANSTDPSVVIPAVAVALLCFVAPLAGLLYMLTDPQRRTIHDRLSGLRVQRLQ